MNKTTTFAVAKHKYFIKMERCACDFDSQSGNKQQPCEASFSSSFEVHAAIGGDPDIDEVVDLFTSISKAVLNIESDNNRPRIRSYRRARRGSVGETKTQLTAEADIIDCDKLGIYFSSEDDIRCFSIVVSILVTSTNGDLSRVSTTAENLVLAAELAFANGEFEQRLKDAEGDISVLLAEMASSNHDEEDNFQDNEEDNSQDDDDSSSISSMDSDDFDNFLETSYREYLQDQNRQEILSRIQPPTSPCTVSEFPNACPMDLEVELKSRMETKVKFDTVVRVKNTLSRHDMAPKEMYNYWISEQESLTMEERDRTLKMLTDRWRRQKEQESKEAEEDLETSSSLLLIPILPAIKQLLPKSEREGHDGYTYTISIRG